MEKSKRKRIIYCYNEEAAPILNHIIDKLEDMGVYFHSFNKNGLPNKEWHSFCFATSEFDLEKDIASIEDDYIEITIHTCTGAMWLDIHTAKDNYMEDGITIGYFELSLFLEFMDALKGITTPIIERR